MPATAEPAAIAATSEVITAAATLSRRRFGSKAFSSAPGSECDGQEALKVSSTKAEKGSKIKDFS